MRKADFDNLTQGGRELNTGHRGTLPAGSARDRRWSGSLASYGHNASVHDMESIRASIAAGRRKKRAP